MQWASTGGKIRQFHLQTIPALDMSLGDYMLVKNDPDYPFRPVTDAGYLTEFSDGTSWNASWAPFVVWIIGNKTGEPSHLVLNVPRGGYNTEEAAMDDETGYADFTIPENFVSKGILLGKYAVRRVGSVYTHNPSTGYFDLRGTIPSTAPSGGGGSSGITDYTQLNQTPSTLEALAFQRVDVTGVTVENVLAENILSTEFDSTDFRLTIPQVVGLGDSLIQLNLNIDENTDSIIANKSRINTHGLSATTLIDSDTETNITHFKAQKDSSSAILEQVINFNTNTYVNNDDIFLIDSIAWWGNSLTNGSGGGGVNSPNELSRISGNYVFNGGVGGETSTEIKNRMIADPSKFDWPTIIWAGTNGADIGFDVEDDIAEMVDSLNHDNYIILATPNGDYASKYKGTVGYNELISRNNRLKAVYGIRYLDIRGVLIELYDQSNSLDIIDRERDIIPSSLRSDLIHLTASGYTHVAEAVYKKIGILIPETGHILSKGNVSSIIDSSRNSVTLDVAVLNGNKTDSDIEIGSNLTLTGGQTNLNFYNPAIGAFGPFNTGRIKSYNVVNNGSGLLEFYTSQNGVENLVLTLNRDKTAIYTHTVSGAQSILDIDYQQWGEIKTYADNASIGVINPTIGRLPYNINGVEFGDTPLSFDGTDIILNDNGSSGSTTFQVNLTTNVGRNSLNDVDNAQISSMVDFEQENGLRIIAGEYGVGGKSYIDLANSLAKNNLIKMGHRISSVTGSGTTTANQYLAINEISYDGSSIITEYEIARFTEDGNFLLGGTTDNNYKMDVTGSANFSDSITALGGNSTQWNDAYLNRITSLTTTGNSGVSTLIANTLNIPNYTLSGLGGQPQLDGTGFVKATGTTISYDNSTYKLDFTENTGFNKNFGAIAGTTTQGNDIRLSDARIPLTHKISHQNGGTDEINIGGLSGVLVDNQPTDKSLNWTGTFDGQEGIYYLDYDNFTNTPSLDFLPSTGGTITGTLSIDELDNGIDDLMFMSQQSGFVTDASTSLIYTLRNANVGFVAAEFGSIVIQPRPGAYSSIHFRTLDSERMRINRDGKLFVYEEATFSNSIAALSFTASTGATIDEFSTDGTLAGNSDTAVPTEKAVKTYVSNVAIEQSLSGPSVTMNVNSGSKATITLTGNTTLTITNLLAGSIEGSIEVVNGATPYTLNINGSTGYTTEKIMGVNSVIDPTASSSTTVVFWRTGSTLKYGFIYEN